MTAKRATPGRATVRPRYARITAFTGSMLVTVVAVLGGAGVLPSGGEASYAAAPGDAGPVTLSAQVQEPPPADGTAGRPLEGTDASASRELGSVPGPGSSSASAEPLPADSGDGRRVVFDQSDQRVWLVRANGTVARTYLVSGSLYDNLQPGTYSVYSRSEKAFGVDESGTMRYMVRFAHGTTAAIGFHDIPVLDGRKVQSRAELGTPQSHGCIRQWRPDAKALWRFAPLGTTVVVTA